MKRKILLLFLLAAHPGPGRNLENRWGFGVSLQDFNSLPSLSLRRHFNPHISASFLAGFDTSDKTNASILGGKFMRLVYLEENLNFFMGVGAFFIADRGDTPNTSNGFEFDGLLGAEFFISGLPNLGVLLETGFAVRTVRKVVFRTIAGTAIHYYF